MRQVIIILIVVVVIVVGGFLVFKNSSHEKGEGPQRTGEQGQFGQKPGEKDETFQGGDVPEPPSGEVSLYKGFWMPCAYIGGTCQSMNSPALLEEVGANIIGLAPNIRINYDGEVAFYPMDMVEGKLKEYAEDYYIKGIRIFLSPELDFAEDINTQSMGEPRQIPKEAAAQANFLRNYNLIVENLAKLAEKYHVEFFSPMNEPDMKLGISVASKWGQEILPIIKKNYRGKILWKVGLGTDSGLKNINFKGYDIIGIDFTAPGGPSEAESVASFPSIVKNAINNMNSIAKRDSVASTMLTEVGIWGGAIKFSEETKVQIHKIIFEQGMGKVDGFIILDPPTDLGDRKLKGSATLEEIKKWFLK